MSNNHQALEKTKAQNYLTWLFYFLNSKKSNDLKKRCSNMFKSKNDILVTNKVNKSF